MTRLVGGRTTDGHDLGVLMLDTVFPRLPGDVGNALTWPFPVRYEVVRGADPPRIMGPDPDPDLLGPFVDAACRLEAEGVALITTSCGFLAIFQRELAAAVSIPVVSSALLQVPLAARLIGPDRKVGILTERPNLTEGHFAGVGWSAADLDVTIAAMPDDAVFPTVFIDGAPEAEAEVLERDLLDLATGLVRDEPDVGALVLECTNFGPWSAAIRRVTGRPVFDLRTAVLQVHLAAIGAPFGVDPSIRRS
jgi:hypothetical protein